MGNLDDNVENMSVVGTIQDALRRIIREHIESNSDRVHLLHATQQFFLSLLINTSTATMHSANHSYIHALLAHMRQVYTDWACFTTKDDGVVATDTNEIPDNTSFVIFSDTSRFYAFDMDKTTMIFIVEDFTRTTMKQMYGKIVIPKSEIKSYLILLEPGKKRDFFELISQESEPNDYKSKDQNIPDT